MLLITSNVGFLVFIGRAILLVSNTVILFFRGELDHPIEGPVLSEAIGMILCAGLQIPLAIYSIKSLRGENSSSWILPKPSLRSNLFLVILWLGLFISVVLFTSQPQMGSWLSSIAFLFGLFLPLAHLVWLASGGLLIGSRRRLWAAISLGMTGSTGLAIFIEYCFVAVAVAIGLVISIFNPTLLQIGKDLTGQIQAGIEPEQLVNIIYPYLNNPWIFICLLLFTSLIAPIVEEAIKPLAVWLIGKHLHSPAEGFVLGAVSGAGFTLIESLLATNNMIEFAYFGLPARFASSLMHISLCGFVGWGIASGLVKKKWGHFALAYSISVFLHGLWNGSVLLVLFGSLRFMIDGITPDNSDIIAIFVGGVMLLLEFFLLAITIPFFNRMLRKWQSDIIAPRSSPP